MTYKSGMIVEYTSYGHILRATIIKVSDNGQILVLDNKRWIHATSVEVVI